MNKKQKEVQQTFLNNEKAVLKKLESNYKDALDEINNRIAILQSRDDADMQYVIYQIEYQKALKAQVQAILEQLQSKNFDTVSAYLTKSYEDGFIGTMYDLQGQGIPLVFPIDQEQVVAAIQHETKLSESLYSSLGKDTKVLSKQIAGEISRGISNAAMYSEMARNIAGYAGISKNKAMRIARTEAHRIQCKATADAQRKAKEKGADVVKQWDASLDGKTRDTHRELDGQIRELDEPFEVAGMEAMQPGGFGIASEDCNCRCALLQRARWALGNDYTKWSPDAPVLISDDGTTQFTVLKEKDYQTFKDKYQKAAEEVRVRSSAQKMNKEISDEQRIKEINKSGTESLLNAYDDRRIHFGLNETPISELKKQKTNPFTVNYNGVPIDVAKSFDDTIQNLSKEYYTGFTKIRVGDKKEFFGTQIFAQTQHNNLVGQKTLVLNPHKVGNYEKMVERIKELSSKGYAVKIPEGLEKKYIATHEFAHSLMDLSGNYKNYIGMDVKQMKGIKKEIDSMFDSYKSAVTALEGEYKKKELKVLNASFTADIDELNKLQSEAIEAKRKLDAVKISKYSMENADEFMAEAFAQEKLSEDPSPYAKKVLDVVDKYFRKKPLENTAKSGKIKSNLQYFARMPEEKFTKYALDPSNAPDKAKAFEAALGYTSKNADDLIKNIKDHIDESKFVEKGDKGHGMRYEYVMKLKGANGKEANVMTAWIDDNGEKRLTSVYVTKKKVTE